MESTDQRTHLLSIGFVFTASVAFSVNDLVFKLLSDTYPLHQMMFVRALVALMFCVSIIVPMSGGRAALRTRRPQMHLLRGFFVIISNITLYTGLAFLPLADTIAVFFSAPLMITVLSFAILSEKIGIWRWTAVIAGFLGVLLIMKPANASIGWSTVLPIAAAFTYAIVQVITRWIGLTERAATLFFYNQVIFVTFSAAIGLWVGDGRFATPDNPALNFLLRAWVPISNWDLTMLIILGALSAGGGYLMTRAYQQSPSNLVAPFEYVALIMAVVWGFAFFGRLPDLVASLGILLILASGVGITLREAKLGIRPHNRHTDQ